MVILIFFSNISQSEIEEFHKGELKTAYQKYYHSLIIVALKYCAPPDAESIVHDVFAMLLENREARLSFQQGNLKNWLCTIVKNRSINLYNREKRSVNYDEVVSVGTEPVEVHFEHQVELNNLVKRFMDKILPEKYHPFFIGRYIERKGQEEVAAILNMNRSTVQEWQRKIEKLFLDFYEKQT